MYIENYDTSIDVFKKPINKGSRYIIEGFVMTPNLEKHFSILEPYGCTIEMFFYLIAQEIMFSPISVNDQYFFDLNNLDYSSLSDVLMENFDSCIETGEYHNCVTDPHLLMSKVWAILTELIQYLNPYILNIILTEKMKLVNSHFIGWVSVAEAVIAIDDIVISPISQQMTIIDIVANLE